MTITLELKPEEVKALNEQAQAQGTDIDAVLHGLVAQIAPAPPPPAKPELNERQKAAIALMQQWIAAKDQLTEAELEQNDREFEGFKNNINRWRAEEGRAPAFP